MIFTHDIPVSGIFPDFPDLKISTHEVGLLSTYIKIQIILYFEYRVEKRILPVEFYVYFYSMVHDINLKIGINDPQDLSYDTIKALNIESASVSNDFFYDYFNFPIKT